MNNENQGIPEEEDKNIEKKHKRKKRAVKLEKTVNKEEEEKSDKDSVIFCTPQKTLFEQFLSIRYWLQQVFFGEMIMSKYFTKVDEIIQEVEKKCFSVDLDIITDSKLLCTLEKIASMENIPENDYRIKERSKCLFEELQARISNPLL